MKTPLRLFIAFLLAIIVQGYSFAQEVRSNLKDLTDVKAGITREFTVTTEGGSGQLVTGKFTFTPYQSGDIIMQYKAPGADTYTALTVGADGVIMFGPEAGFEFTAAAKTHSFRILFNRGDTYNYRIDLMTVGTTPTSVANTTGTVTVVTPTQFPTIDGTLDNISQNEGITANAQKDFQILVTTNEFVGVRGNIQIVLTNPAQRENISLQYDANRAITNGGETDFQALTFDENGVATIGPEDGEVLGANGINQIMKVTFSQPGSYAYTLRFRRDDGNAIASVNETVTVANVAAIDDMIGDTRIAVYPTIAKGAVRIELGDVRNASISVTDMLGRVVMQREKAAGSVNINTSTFSKGTYFVKIIKGNDVAGSRFIVQ